MNNGPLYEYLSFISYTLTAIYIYSLWRKGEEERAEVLSSILLLGSFFGLSWEFLGTGLIWIYLGYRIYAFDGAPLAIIIS